MNNVETFRRIAHAIEYNCNWFSNRSERYKRFHFSLQIATILLPLITMLVEVNFHIISLNLTLLLLVSALASINITLTPFQNWKRFKCAEVDFRALQLRFELETEALGEGIGIAPEVGAKYIEETRQLLQKYANDHFQELQISLKDKPVQ